MSENNHIDDLFRSVLENGQEEVPARVWEGVSAGLDKVARRKAVVIWLGRVGAVAAAAAVAVGVMLNIRQDDTLIPEASDSGMIAVVEQKAVQVPTEGETEVTEVRNLTAYVPEAFTEVTQHEVITEAGDTASSKETVTAEKAVPQKQIIEPIQDRQVETTDTAADESSDWEEDKIVVKERRVRTSLVLSGVAGTNNPQNKGSLSPMRSPALGKTYTKSTVEQTSIETLYGIPVSVGAGVKLRFSEKWSLGMGLNYTLLTSKFHGKYTKVEDGVAQPPVSSNIRNSQHYIGIPVNAYYDIVNHNFVNVYAYAGGTVEKCIMNRHEIQTSPVIHHVEDTKGVQLSANAGIGVEFMLGRYVGIYIDPSLRYYFRSGQPKSIRTAQPLMLGFEMGLRFNL